MDKIETALTATEDNAAAIRALSNKLREKTEAMESKITALFTNANKTTKLLSGLAAAVELLTSVHIIRGKKTTRGLTFGIVESTSDTCAIVTFDDSEQRKVIFNNKVLATSFSPAFVKLPAAKAELFVLAGSIGSIMIFGLGADEKAL